MTETAIKYQVESPIDESVDELTELNFKVAAIAGWTEITELHISRNQKANVLKKAYIGLSDRTGLRTFVPDYTSDLSAISNVFRWSATSWSVTQYTNSVVAWAVSDEKVFSQTTHAESPAIALCKLLLKLYG